MNIYIFIEREREREIPPPAPLLSSSLGRASARGARRAAG